MYQLLIPFKFLNFFSINFESFFVKIFANFSLNIFLRILKCIELTPRSRDRERKRDRSSKKDKDSKDFKDSKEGSKKDAKATGDDVKKEVKDEPMEESAADDAKKPAAEKAVEPLSLEELLEKKKREEAEAAKPKFLTKEQRVAEALKKRQEQVTMTFMLKVPLGSAG